LHRQALRQAGHAYCYSAGPVVVAVMPPTPDRAHPTELLLSAHHYRASREALAASGATVFDRNGLPVLAQDAALVGAR
jgi:hypothetical protein